MAWPDASLLPLSAPPSRLSSSDSMSSSSLLPRPRLLLLRLDLSESDSEVESRRFLCLRRLRSESLSPLLECRLLLSFLRLFLWRDLDRDLDRRFLLLSRLLLLDFRFLFFGLSSSESEERSTTALAGTARVGMTSLGGAGGGQMLTALTFSDCSVLSLSAWAASVSVIRSIQLSVSTSQRGSYQDTFQ